MHPGRGIDTAVAPRGPSRRRPIFWVAILFVAFAMIVLGAFGAAIMLGYEPKIHTLEPMFPAVGTTSKLEGSGMDQSSRTDGSASLAFHRGDIHLIGFLYMNQEREISDVFRVADQEYLKIEQRHTKREIANDGTLIVTVMPFKEELKSLEDRVWSQLQVLLRFNDQYTKAQKLLPVRGSLFPFGTEEITIEISRTPDRFRWRLSKPGDRGKGQWFSAPHLPDDYAHFCEK